MNTRAVWRPLSLSHHHSERHHNLLLGMRQPLLMPSGYIKQAHRIRSRFNHDCAVFWLLYRTAWIVLFIAYHIRPVPVYERLQVPQMVLHPHWANYLCSTRTSLHKRSVAQGINPERMYSTPAIIACESNDNPRFGPYYTGQLNKP